MAQFLHWNPSKRPTTSIALRSPYFTKEPPAAALANGLANHLLSKSTNTVSTKRSNMAKVNANGSSTSTSIAPGSLRKSSIPVAQSDYKINQKSPASLDTVKATQSFSNGLKSSVTYGDLTISSNDTHTNVDSGNGSLGLNQFSLEESGSFEHRTSQSTSFNENLEKQQSIGRKNSFADNGKHHHHHLHNSLNKAKFISSSESVNDEDYSSILNDAKQKGHFAQSDFTHARSDKSSARDSGRQQRVLKDFLSSDFDSRKENSIPRNSQLGRRAMANQSKSMDPAPSAMTPSPPKYYGTAPAYTGNGGGDVVEYAKGGKSVNRSSLVDSVSNVSAKEAYISRSRYITGQAVKGYPSQGNNSVPGSNHSNTSRSAGEWAAGDGEGDGHGYESVGGSDEDGNGRGNGNCNIICKTLYTKSDKGKKIIFPFITHHHSSVDTDGINQVTALTCSTSVSSSPSSFNNSCCHKYYHHRHLFQQFKHKNHLTRNTTTTLGHRTWKSYERQASSCCSGHENTPRVYSCCYDSLDTDVTSLSYRDIALSNAAIDPCCSRSDVILHGDVDGHGHPHRHQYSSNPDLLSTLRATFLPFSLIGVRMTKDAGKNVLNR